MEVNDYNPPPVAVDADELYALLRGLPGLCNSGAFLLSTRLYSEALEIIEERPEIAYLLLVACIETIASAELTDWKPDEVDRIESKGRLVAAACQLGLDMQDAEKLALMATSDNPWSGRKFTKFLTEHVDESLWTSRDELYVFVAEGFSPPKARFERALSAVWKARNATLHHGARRGPSVGVGTTTMVHAGAMTDLLTGAPSVPPVTWFERVVNLALCTYLRRNHGTPAAPESA